MKFACVKRIKADNKTDNIYVNLDNVLYICKHPSNKGESILVLGHNLTIHIEDYPDQVFSGEIWEV